jgi:hypothetical protein
MRVEPSPDLKRARELGHLPRRYWLRDARGLWFSVARGSPAHLADAARRAKP